MAINAPTFDIPPARGRYLATPTIVVCRLEYMAGHGGYYRWREVSYHFAAGAALERAKAIREGIARDAFTAAGKRWSRMVWIEGRQSATRVYSTRRRKRARA